MQYLKEDVKQRILAAALEVFKEKGYTGASIRNIASSAGIALGTVYKYFESKEDLFHSLVEPVYKEMFLTLRKIMDSDVNPIEKLMDIKDKTLDLFKENSKELLILFDKSEGSPYQNFREELTAAVHTILQKELLLLLTEKGVIVKEPFIFYVLSTTLVEGVCTLLKTQEDGAKISYLIDQLIHILFTDIERRFI